MKIKQIAKTMRAWITVVMVCAGMLMSPRASAGVPYPNDLYLTQVGAVTCTLVGNAMMLRARMYLSNNSTWTAITEDSLEPIGWLEGVGMRNSFTWNYAGNSITVNYAYTNGLTVASLQNILAAHPEGVVIYTPSIPHGQWVTDVENGIVYSADTSWSGYFGRRPITNTLQGQYLGTQENVLANVSSYWYVSSYNITANTNYGNGGNNGGGTTTTTTQSSQNLPNGTYRIACYGDMKYGLDIDAGSQANEANVQLWEYVGSNQQHFKMIFKDDHYNIQAVHSGKNLDFKLAGSTAGTNVQQYEIDGTDVQNWSLQDAGDGAYYIVNHNGLYMDVNGGTIANGTNIQGWTGNKSDAQKWIFIAVDGGQTLPDGDYNIRSAKNFNYGVDVEGVSTANAANVHLWEVGNGANQKWTVKYLGNGYYSIIAKHSGKALNVHGAEYKGYANVQQHDYSANDAASMWMLKDAGNGNFYIINKNGRFLDIANGAVANGSNIGGWCGNSTEAQKWKFVTVDGTQTLANGLYQIRSVTNKNLGLDVDHASKDDHANVLLYTISTADNQKWEIKYLSNGFYSIVAHHSGKALDVENAGIDNFANVQQYANTAATNDAQQWAIKDAGNGAYYIINKKGLFLDINGGTLADGTNIQGYVGNGTLAQKWMFTSVSTEKTVPVISDIKVTNVTPSGYTVSCTVTDKNGIKEVKMPTWTAAGGQDDIVWHQATINGNTATCNIKIADHKNERGTYITHVYAYNNQDNKTSKAAPAVTVPEVVVDTEKPVITDVKISNISQAGYTVTCTVNDNVGVTSVKMPTWTNANGQDDIKWHEAAINGNTASFTVKKSDHKNEFGFYITHIYAYDEAGNSNAVSAGTIDVPVANGTYHISCFGNTVYGLDVTGANTDNGTNLELWETVSTANHHKFKLNEEGDGYYSIKDVNSGKALDVDNGKAEAGTNVQIYDWNGTPAQLWKPVHNEDGSYRLVSKLNSNLSLDVNGGNIANGSNVQIWTNNNTVAQKWSFTSTTATAATGNGYATYQGGRGGSGNILAYGVDVSEHQGVGYNFQALKNAGYSYVILRCGFVSRKDYRFEEYYQAAKAAGLDVGVYFYSYASTPSEALYEANQCLSYIAGKKFEYPIYFDFEDPCAYGSDSYNLCMTFLNRVASQGYLVGLYGYASWLDEDYGGHWVPTAQICQKYECWIANYPYANYVDNYTNVYKTRYGMFQFTSGASSQGLAYGAGIDTDICFKDYPSIVRQHGFNGYAASRTPVVYNTGEGVVAPEEVSGINEVDVKTVKDVQYININGQVSDRPFDGINVVVTNYTDGSKDVKKIMK